MSTTPPPEQQPGPAYGAYRGINAGALMPIPGNAELVVYILAVIIIAIIALASSLVNAPGFVTAFMWLTSAYLISRGIAKASRVRER